MFLIHNNILSTGTNLNTVLFRATKGHTSIKLNNVGILSIQKTPEFTHFKKVDTGYSPKTLGNYVQSRFHQRALAANQKANRDCRVDVTSTGMTEYLK